MLQLILGFLGGPLKQVIKSLEQANRDKLNAANDADRIAADVRIKVLEARRDVILKAQSDKYERWIRILLALPFVIFIWKLVVWDKVLALGTTDDLSPALWTVLYIVLGGYFVNTVASRFIK